MNLRKRKLVSYYELEESPLDEYVYCEKCNDFVYEYCSIHGPLLVVPDDKINYFWTKKGPINYYLPITRRAYQRHRLQKVPARPNYPPSVPRAALTIPQTFLHIAPSIIPGAGLGVFSTLTLPKGVRFGPYRGKRTTEISSPYCWQIYDSLKKIYVAVDAEDVNASNWMRYVNCARHWREQNLVAYQYQGQIYYRTIKIIPRFTELMVFYGSQFAYSLGVDLKKYNVPQCYESVIGIRYIEEEREEENKQFARKYAEESNININNYNLTEEIVDKENILGVQKENHLQRIQNESNIFNDDKSILVKYDSNNQFFELTFNKNVTGGTQYACSVCNKSYRSKNSLRRHYKSHRDKRDFNCPYCNYDTNFKYKLNEHIQKHLGTVIYKCNLCQYSNHAKQNYQKHMRRKHFTIGTAIESTPYSILTTKTLDF